jgi:hypothetical protein
MSDDPITSAERAFNARWLTPIQVAKTFVPPQCFDALAGLTHTLLVGPRGSGKTTLLKMLQPKALEAWTSEDALHLKERIDFVGVFIPADLSWKRQVEALANLRGQSGEVVPRAAFTISVLHALVQVAAWRCSVLDARFRPFKRVAIDQNVETELVREVSRAWRLSLDAFSLIALKHELRRSLQDLDQDGRGPQSISGEFEHLYSLGPIGAATTFVEFFNDMVGEPDQRWALLVDELEIAPDDIQQSLLSGARSRDERLLLKLALSPFNKHFAALTGHQAPRSMHDYEQIQLWVAAKKSEGRAAVSKEFCEKMWFMALEQRGLPRTSPYRALGESYALEDQADHDQETTPTTPQAVGSRRRSSPYARTGKWGIRFIELAKKDASFRTYLSDQGVDPEKLDELPEPVRAQVVRKVTPIVAVREFYRKADSDSENPGTRSRKSHELYVGADSFFAISESNPRWLKATLSRMLDGLNAERGYIVVGKEKQSAAIEGAAHRFSALLASWPGPIGNKYRTRNMLDLIRRIGAYFHRSLVQGPFETQPPLSFIVDANASSDLLDALQEALNLGAIVYVPDEGSDLALGSLRGKRFRLAYWLAPTTGLPLNLGDSVPLSRIFDANADQQHRDDRQLNLGVQE